MTVISALLAATASTALAPNNAPSSKSSITSPPINVAAAPSVRTAPTIVYPTPAGVVDSNPDTLTSNV